MRLAVEILLVSALIYLGWDKAFRDWVPNSKAAIGRNCTVTSTPDDSAAACLDARS